MIQEKANEILNQKNKYIYSKDYIENNTNLFQCDFLGYPWYKVALETIHNSRAKCINPKTSNKLTRQTRLNDFKSKQHILDSDFEYVFITKSKQFRRDKNQKENFIFYDILKYLKQKNKSFVVLEIPENSDRYDTRYLQSSFAKHTIPFECFVDSIIPIYRDSINNSKKTFLYTIHELFNGAKIPDQHVEFTQLLKTFYIKLAEFILRDLCIFKEILTQKNIKCLFGSMGTHYIAGIDNSFCVCEVGHGVGVRNNYSNKPLIDYYDRNYNLDMLYYLELNCLMKRNSTSNHFPFYIDNIFNYGMPEIRNYKYSKENYLLIKKKYNIKPRKILLIFTAGGRLNEEIVNLIYYINSNFSDVFILLRQHPNYDSVISINNIDNFAYANDDNLFNVLSIADIVISPSSTVVHEASVFTGNIILYPKIKGFKSKSKYFQAYPCKAVIDIDNLELMRDTIREMLSKEKYSCMNYRDNYHEELDRLFKKIEKKDVDKKSFHCKKTVYSRNTTINSDKSIQGDSVMVEHSKLEIDNFINPVLTPDFSDLYIIRKAIKDSLTENLHNFKGTLLDVGFGEMPYRDYVIQNSNVEKYIGLDFGQGKYADLKKPDITWDGKHIPLEENSVDCAMATEVLEHCSDPLEVLKEIRRVLNPDGVFFFTVPFIWPLHFIPHDHYRYTPFAIEQLLSKAGFKDIRIKPMGGWDAALAQMIGLWVKRKAMPGNVRKQVMKDFFPLYKQLIEADVAPSDFTKGGMFTGLSGIARKSDVQMSKSETSISSVNDKTDKRVCYTNHVGDNLKQRKKAVIVVNIFPKLSETFILSQITGLIDRGVDIEIWARSMSDETVIHSDLGKYNLLNKTRYLKFPEISLKFTDKWFNEFLRLNEDINVDNVHLFHVHFGINFNELKPLFLKTSAPIIVSFHGLDASQYIKQHGDKCYETLFNRAETITTPSYYMKNILTSKGCPQNKVLVHRYGVELEIFKPCLKQQSNGEGVTLLTVGRLVEKKGLEDSLKAFSRIKNANVTYRIAGDGPLQNKLSKLCEDLQISDKVIFLGAMTSDCVVQEMRKADIFVLTSITAKNGDQEGVPVTLIEAHAMGLPVVSTFHSGIPELVIDGETGLLAAEGDVSAIASNLQKLITNSDLRNSMSQKARNRVQREFNINLLNDNLANIYSEKINSGNNGSNSNKTCHVTPQNVVCPICGGKYDAFLPFGVNPRPNALCPGCNSLERHRLIWLYLKNNTGLFNYRVKLLHIAPEPFFRDIFERHKNIEYTTIDLYSKNVDYNMDLTNLQFQDNLFDAVICIHVLEHVYDDRKAISELFRVIKPAGWGIIQVPIKDNLEKTVEGAHITDLAERKKLFGQEDHLRYYGLDYTERIKGAGFNLWVEDYASKIGEQKIQLHRLSRKPIFVCKKPIETTSSDGKKLTSYQNLVEFYNRIGNQNKKSYYEKLLQMQNQLIHEEIRN